MQGTGAPGLRGRGCVQKGPTLQGYQRAGSVGTSERIILVAGSRSRSPLLGDIWTCGDPEAQHFAPAPEAPEGHYPSASASQGVSGGFYGNGTSVPVHFLPSPISSPSHRCVSKQLPVGLLHADPHLHFHAESVSQKSNLSYTVTEKGRVKERKGGMVTRLAVIAL